MKAMARNDWRLAKQMEGHREIATALRLRQQAEKLNQTRQEGKSTTDQISSGERLLNAPEVTRVAPPPPAHPPYSNAR